MESEDFGMSKRDWDVIVREVEAGRVDYQTIVDAINDRENVREVETC